MLTVLATTWTPRHRMPRMGMNMGRVESIIKRIDTLTPLSRVVNRILTVADDPQHSIADLADLVKRDLTLTANLLKLCNSAYYGFPVHVQSVDHAVKLLGARKTIELALVGSIGGNLVREPKGYQLKRGELWTVSVASAMLAGEWTDTHHPELDRYFIYTACLLKDIGKVVIESDIGRAMPKIERLVERRGYSFDEAETEVIGINHAELGALIAERWNFGPRLVYLIRHHHLDTPDARRDVETGLVYLADTIARMARAGIGADGLAYRVYGDIFGQLGVSEADLDDLTAAFKLHLNVAQRLFLAL